MILVFRWVPKPCGGRATGDDERAQNAGQNASSVRAGGNLERWFQAFGETALRRFEEGDLFELVSAHLIVFLLAKHCAVRAAEIGKGLLTAPALADAFILAACVDGSRDSNKGERLRTKENLALIHAFIPEESLEAVARERMEADLPTVVKACWESVLDGKARYVLDGTVAGM